MRTEAIALLALAVGSKISHDPVLHLLYRHLYMVSKGGVDVEIPNWIRPTSNMNENKSALVYAQSWVRRSPGPDAWSNLAAAYATRDPPDLKKARFWYRRAASKGNATGLFEYGLMLIQGEGGPKRPAQGRRYLERAAELGQISALEVLSYALSEGAYGYRRSINRARQVNGALRRARLSNR